MYYLNKIVFIFLNPVGIVLLLLGAALAVMIFCDSTKRRYRALSLLLSLLAFAALTFFSIGPAQTMMGMPLEAEFPPQKAEEAPEADAIVLLGGGMSALPEELPYPEMLSGADRVWHAARLYKAGKAPLIITSGKGDADSTVPLLIDFGVPREAIIAENESRNTEENAAFVHKLLSERLSSGATTAETAPAADTVAADTTTAGARKPRILLVTSAWHMRRSLLMFRRYAPDAEVFPAATDHESTLFAKRPFELTLAFPNPDSLRAVGYLAKEYIGYWGYQYLR